MRSWRLFVGTPRVQPTFLVGTTIVNTWHATRSAGIPHAIVPAGRTTPTKAGASTTSGNVVSGARQPISCVTPGSSGGGGAILSPSSISAPPPTATTLIRSRIRITDDC